jgi:hypothetical protein
MERKPPAEVGRSVRAGLLGLTVEAGTFLIGAIVLSSLMWEGMEDQREAIVVLGSALGLGAPGAGAVTACAVENRGAQHRTGCGYPVLAAYGGFAVGAGLFLLAAATDAGDAAKTTALAAALLLPPALSVATVRALRVPDQPTFERPRARRGGGPRGTAIMVPLLRMTF